MHRARLFLFGALQMKLRGIDSRFFESTLQESSFFTSKLLLKKEECYQKRRLLFKKEECLFSNKKIAFLKDDSLSMFVAVVLSIIPSEETCCHTSIYRGHPICFTSVSTIKWMMSKAWVKYDVWEY